MKLYLIFLLIIGLGLIGCDKDDPLPPAPPAQDTEPPTVEITAPMEGSAFAQNSIIDIAATASDNDKVERVDFYRDGIILISDESEPYGTSWTTNKTTETGPHVISARAYDKSENSADADDITITITQP